MKKRSIQSKNIALFWTIAGIMLMVLGGELRMQIGAILCVGGVILSAVGDVQEKLEDKDESNPR